MPWSQKQHNLFEGIAHGSIKPQKGLSKDKAAELASEGVKGPSKGKKNLKTLYGKS